MTVTCLRVVPSSIVVTSLVLGACSASMPASEPGAPAVALLQTPPLLSNASTAAFTFASSATDATFVCRVDSSGFAPCTSPYSVTVSDGKHAFEVEAVRGKQSSPPARYEWTVDTVVPETTVTDAPPERANTSEASFGFHASELASFECRLDGAPFVACASGLSITGLSQSTHRFEVRAIDLAGNVDPSPASVTWTVDQVTPETSILEAPLTPSTSRSAMFSFTADLAGCRFDCALDDSDFQPCSSPVSYTGLADGNHTLRVRATSPAHNVDPTPASYSWLIDATGPSTTITSGPAPEAFTGGDVSFTFTAEPGAVFECALEPQPFGPCSGDGRQDFTNLSDGHHFFVVEARDALGNVGPVVARGFTVDTVRPQIAIDLHDLVSPRDSIFFTVTENAATACTLDGDVIVPCHSPIALSATPEGSHHFEITATDQAGNTATASHDFVLDATPPVMTIVSPTEGQEVGAPTIVQLAASEAIQFYLCRLDDAQFFSNCAATNAFTLHFGTHTIDVYGYDLVLNQSATVHRTFSVDDVMPRVTITSPTDGQTTLGQGTIEFSVSKPATTTCKVTGDADFHPCTSPLAFDLPNGIGTVTIIATDHVGNTGTATRTWNVFSPVPIVTITYPDENLVTPSAVSFQFHADLAVTEYQCQIDAAPFSHCDQGFSVSLPTGQHTIRIHGTGLDGRTGPDAVRTWSVDADHVFVDINISNDCIVDVFPTDIVVPADQTIRILYFNHSHDFAVPEINMSYGGALVDLFPGHHEVDPTPRCTVKGIEEWADVYTAPCSGFPTRVHIHCLN